MCSENQFKSIQFILINTYKYIYTFIYTELNNNNSCLNVFYTVRTLRYSGESVNNQIIFYEEALLSGGKEELPCNRKKPPAETGTGRSHPQPHPPTMREKEKENTAEDLSIAGFSFSDFCFCLRVQLQVLLVWGSSSHCSICSKS